MMSAPKILLVSSDLLASSRLGGVARAAGHTLDVAAPASFPAATDYDLVLVDIQACPDPAAVIARSRTAAPAGRVLAFGPHVWKERLEQAVQAGADAAVTRGEVLEGLAAILDRFAPRS
ncbi:MAG: DNA-binding response regulator [Planctomycetes bacterium]|nr:DNA-binding response regulator [Planctomycetota bacterium]